METKYAIMKFLKTKNKVLFETNSLNELRKYIEWDFKKIHNNNVVLEKPYLYNHLKFSWTSYWIVQTYWKFVVTPKETEEYLSLSLYKDISWKIEKPINKVKQDLSYFWI